MRFLEALAILFLLSACSSTQGSVPSIEPTNSMEPGENTNKNQDYPNIEFPTQIPNAYSPKENDDKKIRSSAYLETSVINIMESYPLQISLTITGSLPTPCHEIRVNVSLPDNKNQILVEVYSVMDPEKMCAQVINPFEITIPMGSYPSGNYSVWINGTQIGNFDS